ncbi:hypothetical protein [Pseudomonas sp. NPDC086251]|jgi:hypothetical protein|uniref:hypothetical protein n=1 Tax=Pseudomonas sp. NPDC086251 TaxID=3364431 RepID=UPI0038389BE8
MTVDIDNLIIQRPVRLAVRATLSSNDGYIEKSGPLQRCSIDQEGLAEKDHACVETGPDPRRRQFSDSSKLNKQSL